MESLTQKDLLERFNITKNEALVFLELLRIRNSKIGKIITHTNLHRGSVYNAIQKLIQKGHVATQKTDKGNLYEASYFGLLKEIDSEHMKLEEKRKIARKIRGWAKVEQENGESSGVKTLSGVNAIKGFWFDLFETQRKNEEAYLNIGGSSGGVGVTDKIGIPYFKYHENMKVKMHVKSIGLQTVNSLKQDWVPLYRGKMKFLPNEFPINIVVYDKKCAMIDWVNDQLPVTLIENKNLIKFYRDVFKLFWKQKAVKAIEIYSPIKI